jgi:hypothetical protein
MKSRSLVTKFAERCDTPEARGKCLGISRLSRIPAAGWPLRSECQEAVTAEEKAAGVRIVKEYREAEQTALDNDVELARRKPTTPSVPRSIRSAFARIFAMDEKTFYGAHAKMAKIARGGCKANSPHFRETH